MMNSHSIRRRKGYRKYHNRKVEYDGIVFDSQKEFRRYKVLMAQEQAGLIKDLQRQVKYTLTPQEREPDVIGPRGGIKRGRVLLNESSYVADFVYIDCATGELVIEDVKGYRTDEYKLKKKMLYQVTKQMYGYGILIKET